jgi:DMSO/TMAO reductase YedYZ molybdopterin-dependent catalytic subunit
LENVLKPECLLAYKMNGKVLPIEHGVPLRLRVENQLESGCGANEAK